MEVSYQVYLPLFVWLAFCVLVFVFCVLCGWAKKQKGAALTVGLFIQMFLPDPKAQQTIEYVTESKAQSGDIQSDKTSLD